MDPKFVLDVSGGLSNEGQNVWAYGNNHSMAQTWKLETVSDPTADAPANGVYFIHNVRNSERVVDVYMGSADNGANVWLYDYNGTRAQQFYLRSLGFGNLYSIVNVYSNKSLDAYNNQTTSGTNIWQYTQNNTSAQMWRLVKNSDGSYTILGAKSNLAFDLYMGWTDNGTNIWLYTQNGTDAQKWVLKEAGDAAGTDVDGEDGNVAAGYYTIVPESATSKNLNVSRASVKENANIELNSTFYHEGETFYVEPTRDGKYRITSFCSGGKALTAGWGEDGTGNANVRQAEYTGDSSQQWYIRVSAKNKNYVTISSSDDQNYVLNAAGTSNGSNVNLVRSSGEKAQRWKLVPAADPNENALAAGTYKIRNVAGQSRVIAVEGRVSGANVSYSDENNARSEFFNVEPVGYGSLYFIKSAASGLSLDVYGGNTASGTNVWAYTPNNTIAQMWRILPTDKGYAVMSANADLALDLYNGSTANGTNIWVYDQNGTNAQKWMFTEAKMDEAPPINTQVIIRSKAVPSRMIEVRDGAGNPGAAIQLYDERQNTSQVFTVEKYGQYYRIVNMASDNVIDIYNGSKDANTRAWSYTWNASSAQLYTIEPTGDGDGSFYIRNINSWLYLTAQSTGNGAQIVQAEKTGNNSQKWLFDTPTLGKGWQKVAGGYRYSDGRGNLFMNAGEIIADSAFDRNNPGKYFFAHEIAVGDPIYQRIYGRSYQENAYISLSDLRYLHVVHYNFDGRIQVGEMIVNAQIADDVLFIFRELFARGYQIRKMHLIDDYWTGDGVSSDAASVTDDNTSCFCFRRATNTDTLSRHALGLAIDLNPLENPFLTFDGDGTVHVLPEAGTYYAYNRSPSIPHVITESDDAYILFSQRGFDWGGHWSSPIDYQHFERN